MKTIQKKLIIVLPAIFFCHSLFAQAGAEMDALNEGRPLGENVPNTWPILFVCVGLYFLLKILKPDWFGKDDL